MEASLLIRLIDQFSAPAQTVRTKMRGLADGFREFGEGVKQSIREGFTESNIEQATRNAEGKLRQARDRMRGALAMGVALVAPLKSIGDFEARLTGFGNTAGIFGDDLKSIEAQLRQMGPQVNKTATEMLDALEYLVGKGMDPTTAMAALRQVGMTSTATGAEITDMAASGYAAIDNLKVGAQDLQLAFDAMAQAGKAGGFELNSMAQYFPGLTAQAGLLKMRGVSAVAELAAALQIARKATGDDATAANNMQNFLMKLSSPETAKRFKEIGINIEKEFKVASDKGVSVFEHMLNLIQKKTGGDPIKIGELFGDAQVISFLAPMMQNMEEFRRIRDAALSAEGVNEADFARVVETLNAKIKAAVIEIGNLVSAGSPLLEIAKELVDRFTALLRTLNDFATANPELTRQIAYGIAGLLAMNIALRTLSYAFWAARLGAIGLSSTFLLFRNGQNIATGWRLLSSAGWVLSGALAAVKFVAVGVGSLLAGITAPAWMLIAALVAAGFALWKYWDRISSFLSGFAAPFRELFAPVVQDAIDLVSGLVDKIGELFGISPENVEAFKAAIAKMFDIGAVVDAAKAALGQFWDWLSSFFSQEQLSGEEQAAMYSAGQRLAQQLIDGLKSIFDAFIAPFRDAFNFAVNIKWPEPPAWVTWLMERAGAAAGAAGSLFDRGRDGVASMLGGGGGSGGYDPSQPGSASSLMTNELSGMDRARRSIEQGGQAAADAIATGADTAGGRFGQTANQQINAGAAAAGRAFGAAAAAEISKIRVPVPGGGGYGQAMRDARAGAIHEGTE